MAALISAHGNCRELWSWSQTPRPLKAVSPGSANKASVANASFVPTSVGYQEGDHVVVAPWGWGDGTCRHCQIGNTHICPNVRRPGFGPHGGFAEFIPVPARYLIKVDNRLKFAELAPRRLACVVGLTQLRLRALQVSCSYRQSSGQTNFFQTNRALKLYSWPS